MLILTNFKQLILGICTLSLIACSSSSNGTNSYLKSYKNTKKNSLPKVPPKKLPGGSGSNWRYLGSTDDNLLAIEINESSIRSTNKIYSFQDRKTVVTPNKYNYQGMPSYKYNLSWWKLSCTQKQFIITASSIYDVYGNLIKNYAFDDNEQWSSVTAGSIAEQQYNYICKGLNRTLGY